VSRSKAAVVVCRFLVFSLLSCYFGHLKLIEPAILHLLLGDVLADGFHYHPIGLENSSCALGLELVCGRLLAESV